MDTRPTGDPGQIADLKQLREDLKQGYAHGRPVPRAVADRDIRDLDRQISTLERLYPS